MYYENYGFDSYWAFSLKGETSNNYYRFPYYTETTFFRFLNKQQRDSFQVGDSLGVWTLTDYGDSVNKRSEVIFDEASVLLPFAAAALVCSTLV